jgi:stage II sporulation protein M
MTIVPHGIFELPAIFLGTSIGLKLGLHPFRRLAGKADTTLLSELSYGLRLFFRLILPLLLLAAAIEVFVTPLLAGIG